LTPSTTHKTKLVAATIAYDDIALGSPRLPNAANAPNTATNKNRVRAATRPAELVDPLVGAPHCGQDAALGDI
jgi:hypothetical protein